MFQKGEYEWGNLEIFFAKAISSKRVTGGKKLYRNREVNKEITKAEYLII